MMKRFVMILAAAGAALCSAYAGIGDWKNFTSMNSVRACASSHDSIWAATSGGVFLYKLSDSSFTRFTNSEGLTTNDITAIVIDRSGSVWLGESDGSIDVLNPSTGKWRYVRDIAVSTRSQKSITSFFITGDSLYIGTAFGVSLFSIPRFEFIDTYANFGTLLIPPVQSVAVFQNRVYAATAKGIAVSRTSAVNLAAPEAWEAYPSVGSVVSLSAWAGTMTAAGAQGLFSFNGSSWIPDGGVVPPVMIAAQTDSLFYFVSQGQLYAYSQSGTLAQVGPVLPDAVAGGTVAGGKPVLATPSHGLAILDRTAGAWTLAAPNGPASNTFVSLAVDGHGAIWCASGRQFGNGFYSYDGSTWKNYSMANLPGLRTNDCFGVAIGPNDSKWISTWGSGIVVLNSAGEYVRTFNDTLPGFVGIPGHPEYIVPAIASTDADGNVWTMVYKATDPASVVWEMKPDSSWHPFSVGSTGYNAMLSVLVDRNNTKWFTNALPGFLPLEPPPRIVYLNEKLNIAGTSDGWGTISEADGATSSYVTAAAEDRDGAIWLGTPNGITVINDPLHPSPVTKVFLGAVRDQYINCIAVDAVNNKWIGTSRGLYVVSPDGTSLITSYSVATSNGKLVDDNIEAIAFDAKNGLAYFGTAKGLSSVGIATIAPSADYGQMAVAPNPFRTWEAPYVTISGLADGSTIKILTTAGKLVKQFPAQGGGRAFWDGTTESGEQAASGIYLAVAYSANGGSIGTAKLALIRR